MSDLVGSPEDRFSLVATRENRATGFPTRSDTNQDVQSQKKARDWKFWI